MDEMDIVRKVTHLFYMFRRDNLLKKDDHPKMKHRDIMVLDAIMKLNDGNLVKMSELSDYFQVTPAAISQIIKQFEKKGWVDRILLDTDRRSVYIQVSEDARRMMKNCEAFMTERLVEFIEELGEEDANAFVCILEKALAYSQKRKEKLEEGEQK